MMLRIFVSLFSIMFACATFAQDKQDDASCDQSANVQIVTNDIFDLTDTDSIFLHNWANALHIKTKDLTLLNEAAFFLKKCEVDSADLAELERHLRSRKYLREAKVTQNEKNEKNAIIIETWDNWSLTPTLDFGRKGGVNKYALGIKDRNLLGLGIDADIEYFSNDQRSGYKFDTQFPLFLNNNINASLRVTDSDDGSSLAFYLQKDFVSFDTPYAYQFGLDNFNQIDTQFQNGEEVTRYAHDQSFLTASWHWLYEDNDEDTIRLGLGYTAHENDFESLEVSDDTNTEFLPKDRNFSYPFMTVEYLQKDYRQFKNLTLINQIEDFNLGWHVSAQLGTELLQRGTSYDAIWRSDISKGVGLWDDAYLFFNAHLAGEWSRNESLDNRVFFKFSTEYFHKINERWGAYAKNANVLSRNQFLDRPIVIGGEDDGVRGYPLQYQHGEHSTQFSLEARYYPHINIYKIFELGGAAFIDVGKTFGDSPVKNTNDSMLASVGIGARFYAVRSSEAQVIHLDLIKPISSDLNVSSLEFRLSTKQSF